MDGAFEKLGFYRMDIQYIQHLYQFDQQVYFDTYASYARKPYLGILVGICDHQYCIPLTSAKPKHLSWSNVSNHNYVIFEFAKQSELKPSDISKPIGNGETHKKILAVLEIGKMIPVDPSVYSRVDFHLETDAAYKDLLEKEYFFLKSRLDGIIRKATDLYMYQEATGMVSPCHCNFKALESALIDYIK